MVNPIADFDKDGNIISSRRGVISRKTSESEVLVELNLDGTGKSQISTTVAFFDHMLDALARHSLIDLTVKASGDTHIDVHHTVEDVAICIGLAIKQSLANKKGLTRFASAYAPLDEALARCVVDLSSRAYLCHTGEPKGQEYHKIGGHFTGSLTRHIFESIAMNAQICLHIDLLKGRDPHHIVECQFKAFALAFKDAITIDERKKDQIPSTKDLL